MWVEILDYNETPMRFFSPIAEYQKSVMQIEECFHPNIRISDWDEKEAVLDSTDICFFAKTDDTIIGEAYAITLEPKEEIEPNDPHYEHWLHIINAFKGSRVGYFYSFAVRPEYQKQGVARQLMKALLDKCNQHYDVLVSHAKEGGSLHLHKEFGCRVVGDPQSNWYNTGSTHHLCVFTF